MSPSETMHRPRPPSSPKKRKKPCFFKFFIPGVTDKHLEVPRAFYKHLEGESSGPVLLKGPSGKIWNVSLTEESNGMFLQGGWMRFVKENFIRVGYCMVFRYYGKYRFTVRIFDTSACEKIENSKEKLCDSTDDENEKEANMAGKKGKKQCDENDDEDDGEVNMAGKKGKKHCDENVIYRRPTLPMHKKCEKLGKQSSEKSSFKTQLSPSTESEVGEKRKRKRGLGLDCNTYISQRRPVTKEEKERAFLAASSFTSKYPTAAVVMRRAYVYYGFYMALPQYFVRSALPKASLSINLCNPRGEEWNAKYIYSEDRGTGGISAGWVSFTFANNLEEEDVCVFEFMEPNRMQVHFFRVVDEIAPLLRRSTKNKKT